MSKTQTLAVIQIAIVAHAIDRAYRASLGDIFVPLWEDAEQAQRDSIVAGVEMHLANPDTTSEELHQAWLDEKLAEGWVIGAMKDLANKIHPCIAPYGELPPEQKAKDHVFRAVVHALAAIELPEPPVSAAPVLAAVVDADIPTGHRLVRYIGHRPDWEDRLYGSGLYFITDQVRAVPNTIATLFLQHPDVFDEPPAASMLRVEPASSAQQPDDTKKLLDKAQKHKDDARRDETQIQDMYDTIDRMADKDALINFAKVNYKHDLKKQVSIENLRTKAKQLVDQFGVV
jgi:hypothetical protein